MKKHLLSSLAIVAASAVCMSASWSQAVPQKPAAGKPGPSATVKSKAATTTEVDRTQKAARTQSNMAKKTDETAKTVTGNLK